MQCVTLYLDSLAAWLADGRLDAWRHFENRVEKSLLWFGCVVHFALVRGLPCEGRFALALGVWSYQPGSRALSTCSTGVLSRQV